MSKESKKSGSTGHTAPDQGSRDQYKRQIEGSITVHGQLETHLPPDLQQKQNTRDEKQDRRENKKFRVEVLTLFFVIIGAGLTGCYVLLTHRIAITGEEALHVQQRPWIGITQAATNYFAYEAGQNITIHGVIAIKNFGPSPAFLVYPITIPTPSYYTFDQQMRSNCQTAKDRLLKSYTSGSASIADRMVEGDTIFPGQEVTSPFVGADTAVGPKPDSPLLAGCVYYRDQWDNIHHTQFCYMLNYTTSNEQLRPCPWENRAD